MLFCIGNEKITEMSVQRPWIDSLPSFYSDRDLQN